MSITIDNQIMILGGNGAKCGEVVIDQTSAQLTIRHGLGRVPNYCGFFQKDLAAHKHIRTYIYGNTGQNTIYNTGTASSFGTGKYTLVKDMDNEYLTFDQSAVSSSTEPYQFYEGQTICWFAW